MRIAYICADPGIPVWGNKGCSIHVQEILRALLRDKNDIDLITPFCCGDCPVGLEGVALHRIDDELPREPSAREQARGQLNQSVNELLSILGPFDFVYERYSLWSYAGVEFAQKTGVPGLLEVNAPLVDEQANHRVLIDRDGAVAATRRAFDAATAVLAVSDEVAEYVLGFGVKHDLVHVLPNAVNATDFGKSSRRLAEADDGRFTIGFVGSLKRWHGVDQLIAAHERLCKAGSSWRLVIAGDGPDCERLESLVRALPDEIASSIEFLGMVPHADIPQLLATFDAAVAPGVSGETYFSPMKLFEYMAAELPIVAARLGQIPSLIDHGVSGLLYNPSDNENLAGTLMSLRGNPQLAAQLGKAARQNVCARHTWDQRRDSIMKIVQQCTLAQAQSAG